VNIASVLARLPNRRRADAHPRTFRPSVEALENRCVPASFLVTGPTPGFQSAVQSFAADFPTGVVSSSARQQAFPLGPDAVTPAFAVAAGDLDGDGQNDEIAAVTRVGGAPFVFLYRLNGDGSLTLFNQFNAGFVGAPPGRAFAAWGNVDGVGGDELILSLAVEPGTPTPGVVRVLFDRGGNGLLSDDVGSAAAFAPYGAALPPGSAIRVAAGDLDGDGKDDLAFSTAGTGSAPLITLWRNVGVGAGVFTPQVITTFAFDFGQGYSGGAFIAIANDVAGGNPGRSELVIGQGNQFAGVGSGVVVILRDNGSFGYSVLRSFDPFAEPPGSIAGVNVGVGNLDGDSYDEIVVGQQRTGSTLAAAFDEDLSALGSLFQAYTAGQVPGEFTRGAFVCVATNEAESFLTTGPAPINDLATASLSISVPANAGVARGVTVFMDLTHTRMPDLDVTLTHMALDGTVTSTELFSDVGGGDDAGPLSLSDAALAIVGRAPLSNPPNLVSGNLRPEIDQALSVFDDQDVSGAWTLAVSDDRAGETGVLRAFRLNVNYGRPDHRRDRNTPATIPDGGRLDQTIQVLDRSNTINGLGVFLDITHPFIGDLRAVLTHTLADGTPGGSVTLFSRLHGNANGYFIRLANVNLIDVADAGVNPSGNIRGNFRPQGTNFFPFFGQFSGGAWTLSIFDEAGGDVGTLNSWSLRFVVE
jgi:subtilisin-like proprotein convertase family protein